MKLQVLQFPATQVSDLSPLQGMPLDILQFGDTKVCDLAPLKGMKLIHLGCQRTPVTDLSPRKGTPLELLECTFELRRDAKILRSIRTLKTINGKPAAEVLK